MPRWLPSLLWYAAAVSMLILQVQGAAAAANPSELIPIFAGVTGGKNSQPPVTTAGGSSTTGATAGTSGGLVLDPLEFSPDAPNTPSTATQIPAAAATATATNATAADNSTTSTTPSTYANGTPSPSNRCTAQHSQMSVENVPGVFCVLGPLICSGSLSDGNCPGVQDGLPLGSHCGVVYTGVYGCRPGPKPA